MLFTDYLKSASAPLTTKQKQLQTQIESVGNVFINSCSTASLSVNKNQLLINAAKTFRENYTKLNKEFREIFCNSKSNSTEFNIYIRNLNGIELRKLVYDNLSDKRVISWDGKFFNKLPYSIDSLFYIFNFEMGMLYNKFGDNLQIFQIIISFLRIMDEYFNIWEVNFTEAFTALQQYKCVVTLDEIAGISNQFGIPLRKKRPSGLTYKKREKKQKYNLKKIASRYSDLLASGMLAKKAKQIIANEIGVSFRTVHTLISECGMTRDYNSK